VTIKSTAETPEAAKAPVVRRLKYEMCKNFREKGDCKYGDRCLFAHGDHELTRRSTEPPTPTPAVEPTAEAIEPKSSEEKE
jgi:hypothetical protein